MLCLGAVCCVPHSNNGSSTVLMCSAKVLLELAEGSSVTIATKLFVDAGLVSHLKGSEALTMLAPLDEAFKGESRSRSGPSSWRSFSLRQLWVLQEVLR